MLPEERKYIMKVLNKMVKLFEKEFSEWSVPPLLKIEIRELRAGDFSLGESIVFDQIKEFQENRIKKLLEGDEE